MKHHVKTSAAKARVERAAWIVKQYKAGKTHEQIANVLDITRQRVQQILAAERSK